MYNRADFHFLRIPGLLGRPVINSWAQCCINTTATPTLAATALHQLTSHLRATVNFILQHTMDDGLIILFSIPQSPMGVWDILRKRGEQELPPFTRPQSGSTTRQLWPSLLAGSMPMEVRPLLPRTFSQNIPADYFRILVNPSSCCRWCYYHGTI